MHQNQKVLWGATGTASRSAALAKSGADYLRAGNADAAVSAYRESLALMPDSIPLQQKMAEAEEVLNKTKLADASRQATLIRERAERKRLKKQRQRREAAVRKAIASGQAAPVASQKPISSKIDGDSRDTLKPNNQQKVDTDLDQGGMCGDLSTLGLTRH